MTAPAYPFNGADRLLRINEVIQLLSISKSTWWEGVRTGQYPQPVRLGARITRWRWLQIAPLIEKGLD
jgi:predicted DNA-binding transcriptional regulator AlpA